VPLRPARSQGAGDTAAREQRSGSREMVAGVACSPWRCSTEHSPTVSLALEVDGTAREEDEEERGWTAG